ncbi:MAG: nucleoside kinase [Bacteroidales bacterium]|nr:nucleoside kinase [Bacteroidales bacterium]
MNLIEISCKNNGAFKKYPYGISLEEIIRDQNIESKYPLLGAYVNHHIFPLQSRLNNHSIVQFFDFTDNNGRRFYFQALTFILYKAVKDCYPEAELSLTHGVPNGYYFILKNLPETISKKVVGIIEHRMQTIIDSDVPFVKNEILRDEAIKIFEQNGLFDKAQLFTRYQNTYIPTYQLDNEINFFQSDLVPSTGYIHLFSLDFYNGGIMLRLPDKNNPEKIAKKIDSPKLFNIFLEHKSWGKLMNAKNIPQLNTHVENNKASFLIKVCEALQEKKIAKIAEDIVNKKSRFVLIAGPSSSGKTTFSKRLSIQLATNGIHSYPISLDNYFVDREHTPKDKEGNFDFECIEAIDVALFNQHLNELNEGKTVSFPRFDFISGKRIYQGDSIQLNSNDVVIIEGIHGLNPKLLETVPHELTYLIFISALTQITIDRLDYISTTDNRLIRRIVRDYRYRKYSALETLQRWNSVRRGEDQNIFPYQENADAMFNSAMIYELGVLKRYAEPLLMEVSEKDVEFGTAQRLLKILSLFQSIPPDEIPPTSILREFLDGSSFHY